MEDTTPENTSRPDKMTVLAPFALAVAESMSNRTFWLGKVKQARWNAKAITHEDYATMHAAYIKAKHRVRDAVAEYRRAQTEYRNGGTPSLSPEWRDWMRMHGATD